MLVFREYLTAQLSPSTRARYQALLRTYLPMTTWSLRKLSHCTGSLSKSPRFESVKLIDQDVYRVSVRLEFGRVWEVAGIGNFHEHYHVIIPSSDRL